LESPLPERQFDMVWYHPPYWNIIRYSDNPNDLSSCKTLKEYEIKLNQSVARLAQAVKPGGILAILIGDKRKDGSYYPLFRTLLSNTRIGYLRAIIIKIQYNCRSDSQKLLHSKFIPDSHQTRILPDFSKRVRLGFVFSK